MHGEVDQIVPIDAFLEAKDFFVKNNYPIESKIFKNCSIGYLLKSQVGSNL